MIFEYVIYLKEIDPRLELAWTKWIKETENDISTCFAIESSKEIKVLSYGLSGAIFLSMVINEKWNQFTQRN